MKNGILNMVRDGLRNLKQTQTEHRRRLFSVPLRSFEAGPKLTIRLLRRRECACAA